jgi:hypothetical protein
MITVGRIIGTAVRADYVSFEIHKTEPPGSSRRLVVRDAAELAKLPQAEPQAWQQFWPDVEALHMKASAAAKAP